MEKSKYLQILDEAISLSEFQKSMVLTGLIGWFSHDEKFQVKIMEFIKEAKEEYPE